MSAPAAKTHRMGVSGTSQAYRPTFLRPAKPADRAEYRALRARLSRYQILDSLKAQLVDLVKVRHPETKLSRREAEALASRGVPDGALEEYGVWVFYPWSCRLVHLLDEAEFAELRTNRNKHKITAAEQETLSGKRVGVVGLSVGQSVAVTMALERGFGEIRLADFDHIDLSNLNRLRTGVHNLGISKAVVAAREIAEIDPYLGVVCFEDGLREENMARFFEEGGSLDLVIEECDSIDMKVLVRYEARRRRVPVVMDTNDRGLLDVERFDLRPDLPLFHGMIREPDPEQLRSLTWGEKVAFVLGIIGDSVSPRLAASMLEIESSIGTWPQLASSVSLGGALAADVSRRILLGQCHANGRFLVDFDAVVPNIPEATKQAEVAIEALDPLDQREMDREAAIAEQNWPARASLSFDQVRAVVEAGSLAPSAGNCQPWKFLWTGQALHIFHDRLRSPWDFRDEASMMALGAAWENCMLESRRLGLEVEAHPLPHGRNSALMVSLTFAPASKSDPTTSYCDATDALVQYIGARHTVRTLTARAPIEKEILSGLGDTAASIRGAAITWLTEDTQLATAGELAGAADRIRFLDPELHRQMMSELRFRPEEAAVAGDGIDARTLGLPQEDRAALELIRSAECVRLLREWNAGSNLKKMSAKAIAASSAVGLLTMPDAPGAFLAAGRAMERVWLKAASLDLGFHPMAALPFLLARITRGDGSGLHASTRRELSELLPIYQSLFRLEAGRVDVILFRLQHGIPKAARSARRPLEDVFLAFSAETQRLASHPTGPPALGSPSPPT